MGKRLASSSGNMVRVWETASGKPLFTCQGYATPYMVWPGPLMKRALLPVAKTIWCVSGTRDSAPPDEGLEDGEVI